MEQSPKLAGIAKIFIDKIENKESLIAIIGLGYVGLPLIMGFNRLGFSVLGVDIDESKITELEKGRSYIGHFSDDDIEQMVDSGHFAATTDFSRLKEADAILLCVPTPLSKHHEPDLSYVTDTTQAIAPFVRKGQLIILESTTYPGTTREVLQPILEKGSGLKADEDFIVAYSPEREDPGNPLFSTATIAKVVGATTSEGLDMAAALYETLIDKVIRVSTPETAEAVKLTENIFRAVNIALVNELKIIYDDMGIDIWEVIDTAATKPFGFMPFYPGPGLGGHCIPIDPFYLTWKAREYDNQTHFIELAGEINRNMPKYVISKLAEALSRKQKKALNGAKVLVVGIAYKKNVDDMRESPSLVLMKLLKEQGAEFEYFDTHIPVIPPTRSHAEFAGMESVQWTHDNIKQFDVVLVATDHDNIDWKLLVDHARLIIDTRNVLKDYSKEYGDKIIKA
ncbi:MAG: nucleotide sugar dehydrogenase [bacterium]|nr:nucleotide sugar dehydrogenase [bacterium]